MNKNSIAFLDDDFGGMELDSTDYPDHIEESDLGAYGNAGDW